MNGSSTIVLAQPDVFLKQIALHIDARATHIQVINERFVTINCVGDIKSVASKVCHVLHEAVVTNVNVRL